MKTLTEIYNPPAPTPSEIYAWSETLKFNRWQTINGVTFGRELPGMISASSKSGLMARVRLKKPGSLVGWDGPISPIPCEPAIEGTESDSQREQMEMLLKHIVVEVAAWLRADEWQEIRDSRKDVKTKVKELRRKAKLFDKKDNEKWTNQAKALARFINVDTVNGLRICIWSDRGCLHVAEFHTGQGIGVPPVKVEKGKKHFAFAVLRQSVATRINQVGLKTMVETLNQFPIVNPV